MNFEALAIQEFRLQSKSLPNANLNICRIRERLGMYYNIAVARAVRLPTCRTVLATDVEEDFLTGSIFRQSVLEISSQTDDRYI